MPDRVTMPPDLAEELSAARRGVGLSRRHLARMVGCTEGTIRHLEAARRAPSGPVIDALAAALSLPAGVVRRLEDVAAMVDGGFLDRFGDEASARRHARRVRQLADRRRWPEGGPPWW